MVRGWWCNNRWPRTDMWGERPSRGPPDTEDDQVTVTYEVPTGYDSTDLFCGAGGSGLGAWAAGVELYMAANHSRIAIDTHAANFPDTEHDCADISQVDPRRYRRT